MTNDTKLLRSEANKTISNAHNCGQTTDVRHCPEVSDVANKKVVFVCYATEQNKCNCYVNVTVQQCTRSTAFSAP